MVRVSAKSWLKRIEFALFKESGVAQSAVRQPGGLMRVTANGKKHAIKKTF